MILPSLRVSGRALADDTDMARLDNADAANDSHF
jgi:hypothetical protein